MRHKKEHIYLHAGALMLVGAYVFIFISHLFLLANLTTTTGINNGSVLSNRPGKSITIQRTDKTIITKNNITNTITNYSHLYIFLRIEEKKAAQDPAHSSQLSQLLTDSHYSYLFNRVLKI